MDTANRQARSLALTVQTHYFLLFTGFAIALTYQNLHFKRIGFSDSQIGTLGAISAVLTLFSPPLWGYVVDRVADKRAPLAFLLVTSGLFYPAFLWADTYAGAALFQVLFSFFMAPCIALTDAMVLELLPRAGGDYGRLRLWGSVGFVCTMVLFGLFLGGGPLSPSGSVGGLAPTFIAFFVLRLLSALWVFRLPQGKGSASASGDIRSDARLLMRDRALMLLFFSAFLSQTALRAYYVFFSIYLDQLGVPDSMKGIFWSMGVVSEVVFMVFAGRVLRALGTRWMLVLGMAGGALRLFLFSFPLPMAAVALAQGLHALAFGASHIAMVSFISASVPDRLRASGQTLYAAVVGGLGGVVGSRLAGDISQAYGMSTAFRACAVLATVATLVALLLPERKAEGAGKA